MYRDNNSFDRFLNSLLAFSDTYSYDENQKMKKDYEKFALSLKALYDSYVLAGFNNGEALQLTIAMINSAVSSNNRGERK